MRLSRLGFVLALLLLAGPPCYAIAAAAAAAPPAIASERDIREIRLDNGLRIFVLERKTSPTLMAYYEFGVGGAADPKGRSGIAHLLEHMMFKGTRDIGTLDAGREAPLMRQLSDLWHQLDRELDRAGSPFAAADSSRIRALQQEIERVSGEHKQLILKNEYDELLTRAGGVGMNASTSFDRTNYYVELPANRLELWFRLESDRLLHPVFREFWSERDVVREERRLSLENQAESLVRQSLLRTLFEAHPYGTPVIGWPRDIERLKQEDAERYFRTYYSPANCVMVLVGDVDTATVERFARKYLGAWKRQEIPALEITAEPAPRGERRRRVEFDAEPSLTLGWVTVPEGDPEGCALDVAATLLGGLASSRLERSLVQEERLATRIGCSHPTMKWGGYLQIAAYPKDEHTLAELEAAIEKEIEKLQTTGVTAEELERAKVPSEVSRVASLKSNRGQAFLIGSAVGIAGSPDYIRIYEERLQGVTAADVQAACKKYLQPSRKCVVEVHKVPGAGGAQERQEAAHHRGGTTGERGAKHSRGFTEAMRLVRAAPPLQLALPVVGKDVTRVVLPSGVTVFVKEDHSAPSVAMRFSWLGGSNSTPVEELPPFMLASRLLNEGGTESLDPIALAEKKEQLGMSFGIGFGGTMSTASFWSLQRNFGESFALAMEILMRPRFDSHRLEVIQGQFIDGQRRRYDTPQRGVSQLRTQVLYADHPRLGYQVSRAEIAAVKPGDVRRVWERYLGRDNLYVTVVGDFDAQGMLTLLERTFAAWRLAADKERQYLVRDPSLHPGVYVVDKEISAPSISISHQARLDRGAPLQDHAALEILNDILGGSGFRSRLMERLRSDEGLTYGIYSSFYHDGRAGIPGEVSISYSTQKQTVARSIDSVLEEFEKMAAGPVAPAEVEEQIDSWRNRFVFQYTDDFYVVASLMGQELDDRAYDYDQQVLEAVQKVTPADVERVARLYLKPENLTICVFGSLTDEDRAALGSKFTVRTLPKEEVFRGGYERPTRPAATGAGALPGVPRMDFEP